MWSRNCLSFRRTWTNPRWSPCYAIFSFLCCVLFIIGCPFFFWPLYCLSFFRYWVFDYTFDVFEDVLVLLISNINQKYGNIIQNYNRFKWYNLLNNRAILHNQQTNHSLMEINHHPTIVQHNHDSKWINIHCRVDFKTKVLLYQT
jgi:hypothetical protein